MINIVVCGDFSGATELIQRVLPSLELPDLQGPSDRSAGLWVLDQLRADEATTAIPVFLLTSDHLALSRHAERLQTLRARPLPKPFAVDQVLDFIEQAAA